MRRLTSVFGALLVILFAGCAGDRQRNDEIERLRQVRERELGNVPVNAPSQAFAESPAATPTVSRERPRWAATGMAEEYPSTQYITGIGSAHQINGQEHAAMTAADGRARGEIAKTIQVRVTAEFQDDVELITQLRDGQYATEKHRTNVAQQITSVTDIVLEGVIIRDRWFDKDSETWWSLAVMDRELAGRAILDRMARRTGELRAVLGLARAADEAKKEFQALSYHNAAVKEMMALLNLRGQLRAVAPALVPVALMPEETAIADVVREAASAGERLRFAVLTEAAAPGLAVSEEPVRTEIERRLREMGLNIIRVNSDELVTVEQIRQQTPSALAKRFGEDADALLVAVFLGKEIAVERMVNLEAHFWQARGDSAVVDLDAGRIVSSYSFDYLPASHTGLPYAQNAAEGALKKAAEEMMNQLKKELVVDLNLVQ